MTELNQFFVAVKRPWVPRALWLVVRPTLRWNPLRHLFARPLTERERGELQ